MSKLLNKIRYYMDKIILDISTRKYLKYPLGKKVYILGTPLHPNLGDSAIVIAEVHFLKKIFGSSKRIKEVASFDYNRKYKKYINNKSLICGLGGGNMGNQWYSEEKFRYDMFSAFPHNPIIIFPQTIHFIDTYNKSADEERSVSFYNYRKDLTIVAREKKSFDIISSMYPNVNKLLTPDIVLSTNMSDFGVVEQERDGILLCIRSDAEKSVDESVWNTIEQYIDQLDIRHNRTDMYSDCPVTKDNRLECVRRKMQEFASARLVITDRLHGMVFAAITGTPCIVFGNYNHKVKGTYDWIKYLPYIKYVESKEEAKNYIPLLLSMGNCKFDNKPLEKYFLELAKEVRVKCQK